MKESTKREKETCGKEHEATADHEDGREDDPMTRRKKM
jgi:hypothetical protein